MVRDVALTKDAENVLGYLICRSPSQDYGSGGEYGQAAMSSSLRTTCQLSGSNVFDKKHSQGQRPDSRTASEEKRSSNRTEPVEAAASPFTAPKNQLRGV